MGIKEFIEEMNKKSRFRWILFKTIPNSDIGFCYELIGASNYDRNYHFQITERVMREFPCDKIMELLEKEISEKEKEYIYGLFKGMTLSMQKAVVDIMKTQNGEQIDDRENDI